MFDAQNSHVYFTDRRLVAVKADIAFFGGSEKSLGNVISEIPYEQIVGVQPGTKLGHSTIDLSVKSPSGEMNGISILFLMETSGFKTNKRTSERDDCIQTILEMREKDIQPKVAPAVSQMEDPIQTLKLRYAKGEISKAEFEDMMQVLKS